ncbi:MAG: AsmA family protein [Verrucomicrobiota bacterium]
MKTNLKVITAIVALGLVILLSLHLFLQHGLTNAMREVVLPRIKAETGIDVRVGRLSLNVPNGILYLKRVEVRNPEGFLLENMASVDRVEVEVDIPSLFKKKPILVKNIEVENALLNVIRNKDGEINVSMLQAKLPQPPAQRDSLRSDGSVRKPEAGTPVPEPEKAKPLPEVLVEALACNAKVRYLDFRLDQLDILLDLGVMGGGISTQRGEDAPWGDVAIIGSLGDDRTSFITDLKLRLAPIVDPAVPSFDLKGKVLEIDPRVMEEVYNDLGIRSAPFGLEPGIYCRAGVFRDSAVTLSLKDIVLEDKLADRLGGMASVDELRFSVPITGALTQPEVDVQQALSGAVGGNAQTLLESFLKGAAAKEAGSQETPETLTDAAVEVLGAHVDEIGESEAAKKALKDLVDGEPSATNAPSLISSDTLVEILGEEVEEIGENEAVKDDLKNLGKWLFGK